MNFTVSDAKAHFADLLKMAEAGQRVIITRHGKPVAKIEAIEKPASLPRIGALKGQIEIAEDFDVPLDIFAPYQK